MISNNFANHLEVPHHALHIFHVHLCNDPHIVSQHPCDTAPHMLPCGTCMKLLTDHVIFSTSPQNFHAPSFRTIQCMPTQNIFSTVPLLTLLALAFNVVNLLLLCNLNFTSSTCLSWLSFRHQTAM